MAELPEIPAEVSELVASLQRGEYETVERCPLCQEQLYSPAETEQHNRDVHNVGPVETTSWGAEP